tara:strand:+ start:613 stop:1353 length:741 start_codon:yes stop_codon:yes gene_type:complete
LKYNYQIIIEYDGTKFNGWQYQKNGFSIQGEIEKVLKKILKKKIRLIGSGRTDSGVHAIGQSANFLYDNLINERKFINSLNHFLNKKSITIISIKRKSFNFHSRYDAKKRIYKYIIINRQSYLALEKNRAWLVKQKLNVSLMKKAAKFLLGTNDFSAFRASSCTAKSPIKTLEKSIVIKTGEKIIITFSSRSFLQQQVRSMVGCIKFIGEEKWKPNKLRDLLRLKRRSFCAPPAPSCGLYLQKVIY